MDRQEYHNLVGILDYHMDRYYNQDEPEISDYEYDQLMQKLKRAEKEHPEWVTPDSPSQKIGGTADSEAGSQVAHRVPMLSVEDVFTREDIIDWTDRVLQMHPDALFSVEAKVDGVSLSLRYQAQENGKLQLVLAETRGNGRVGGDVTENARAIQDVRQVLELPCDYLELRGEAYITNEAHCRYLAGPHAPEEKLADTPRNLAAATLRQLDPQLVKERSLRLLIFNVQDGPAELLDSHTAAMNRLETAGIPVVRHRLCRDSREVWETIEAIDSLRAELPYDLDGVVVKLDQIAYREDFPAGPKYAAGHIAYKFPPKADSE